MNNCPRTKALVLGNERLSNYVKTNQQSYCMGFQVLEKRLVVLNGFCIDKPLSTGRGSKYSIALVVSLNDELAKSIKEELNGQHKNSPFLESFTQLEKDEIINSIDVKSIKQILEEWMPSIDSRGNPDWLISSEFLRELFEKLRNRPGVTLEKMDVSYFARGLSKQYV